MRRISDKVIWITGASSGIGEALAYELSKMGNFLILSSRNKVQLDAVKKRCELTDQVRILPLDLDEHYTVDAKVESALSFFGKIDILINNAGISQRSMILETDLMVYKKLIDVNYLGTVALSKALLPHFIDRRAGHFVTVTSLMGRFGSPYRSGYCGAKHALHGFFDVMRMEHEKDGIAVTLVCPGFVQTNVAKNALTADGAPQKTNDSATEKGMRVTLFARKMIKAIANRKFEVYIGGKETKGIFLKRFFPRLLHKTVLKSQVR